MNKLSNTSILLVLLVIIISSPIQGQWGDWSDPISVTDSIYNHQNPTITYLHFIEENHYMFWERSSDSLSTSICYKRFYQNDEPTVLISKDGVHYRNPQIIGSNYSPLVDTVFMVFYEDDEMGYTDINYMAYTSTGFLPPHKLSESTANKTNLLCNGEGEIIWIEQNKIMYTKLDRLTFEFSNPVVIDSGNNSFPSIIQAEYGWKNGWISSMIAWLRTENDSSFVLVRKFDNEDGWLEPDTIFKGLTCTNLSFCSGIGQSNILTWDYYNDTTWNIRMFDTDANELLTFDFNQEEPFSPFFYSGFIPVKSDYYEGAFLSFRHAQNNTSQILSSAYYGWISNQVEDYQNVSDSENQVNNTQIFTGKFETPCIKQYFINIWEEEVNDHWQLKYVSSYACLSDINENKAEGIQITASPNPFSNEVSISFEIADPGEVHITILNATGLRIYTIEKANLDKGFTPTSGMEECINLVCILYNYKANQAHQQKK